MVEAIYYPGVANKPNSLKGKDKDKQEAKRKEVRDAKALYQKLNRHVPTDWSEVMYEEA